MTNTNNRIPTNGNCKAVRDITNDIRYGSLTEAAMANGVTISTMSTAISNERLCNGNLFMLEKDLHKNGDKLCAQLAKANARIAKAEATRDEMAEFRKWKAEQEAIRKAEEKRACDIIAAQAKVAHYTVECERIEAKLQKMVEKLMAAQSKLDALKGDVA